MTTQFPKNWLTLAEETRPKKNSARLRHLVAELCRAIDDNHETNIRSMLNSSLKD